MRRPSGCPLSIAMIGTRGVPAAYGGFETAVEEIGRRLVERGHEVSVYSRGGDADRSYLGMRRVRLPALQFKQLETLSHTALSVVHAGVRTPDVAFVFNAANSPFLPALRARGVPTALHMDGLEWRRAKWGRAGRGYYRWAEQYGVRWADRLIADAPGIADYYQHEFGVATELLRYGAPLLSDLPDAQLEPYGLSPGGFHLVVARFEPENHVLEIVRGYRASSSTVPLAVVGAAPYAAAYTQAIERAAEGDPRIRLLGPVYDQEVLDQMYFHALTYLHGHSVGGTNPSLLRAIGAGTPVVAHDNVFNREVLGSQGWYFAGSADIAPALAEAESDTDRLRDRAAAMRQRAELDFTWEGVTDGYEATAKELASLGPAPRRRGARRRSVA